MLSKVKTLIDFPDDFVESWFRITNDIMSETSARSLAFRSDISEEGGVYRLDVPGIKPEDIKLELDDDRVTVTLGKKKYRFTIDGRFDASTAKAELELGVLSVFVQPMKSIPKTIEVVVKK